MTQNCDNNFKSVDILKIWGQVAKFQIAVIYIKFDIPQIKYQWNNIQEDVIF